VEDVPRRRFPLVALPRAYGHSSIAGAPKREEREADVGVSDYTATGSVYNLKKLEDFEGTYAAATAGATVAGGVSGAAMRNQNGVLIQLSATRQGLQFTLAPAGIKISLVK
jgi:hypothetical protein